MNKKSDMSSILEEEVNKLKDHSKKQILELKTKIRKTFIETIFQLLMNMAFLLMDLIIIFKTSSTLSKIILWVIVAFLSVGLANLLNRFFTVLDDWKFIKKIERGFKNATE